MIVLGPTSLGWFKTYRIFVIFGTRRIILACIKYIVWICDKIANIGRNEPKKGQIFALSILKSTPPPVVQLVTIISYDSKELDSSFLNYDNWWLLLSRAHLQEGC